MHNAHACVCISASSIHPIYGKIKREEARTIWNARVVFGKRCLHIKCVMENTNGKLQNPIIIVSIHGDQLYAWDYEAHCSVSTYDVSYAK